MDFTYSVFGASENHAIFYIKIYIEWLGISGNRIRFKKIKNVVKFQINLKYVVIKHFIIKLLKGIEKAYV